MWLAGSCQTHYGICRIPQKTCNFPVVLQLNHVKSLIKNTHFHTFFGFLNGGCWVSYGCSSLAFPRHFWLFSPGWNLHPPETSARTPSLLLIDFRQFHESAVEHEKDLASGSKGRSRHVDTFSWEWNSWNWWNLMKIWDENMGTPEVWSPVFETILWVHGVRVCQGHPKNFPSTTMNGYVFQKNCSDPFLSPWPGLIFSLEGLVGTATDRWTKYLLRLNLQSASCSSLRKMVLGGISKYMVSFF